MPSKDSNIILLNDGMYRYEVPLKPPSDEKDIINYNLPKAQQFWHTPEIKRVKNLTEKERIYYIERERQRWEEGVYVLINGELTYITGMHYDHLTYMTFKDAKAEYFDHQRFDFYFRDLTRKDPKCRGRVWMKPRRYGMTMEEITEGTYSLNENFSNNVGIQSDTKDKVRDTILTPIINSYVKRPKWMRSDYYKPNGKLLVTQLNLNNNMAPDDDGSDKGDFLLGWLKGFPALPRAMDGNEMIYIIMDEVWKWQESSPKETLESNMKVLMGRNRAGLVSVLSTMGDSDDFLRAVLDGVDIIARSNPSIRDDNGVTLSGLYKFFVSAIYSFDIPPEVFEVDTFGKINKDKHLTYVQNKINKLDKNSKSYVFEKRRLPLCEADAVMSAQMVTYFRKIAISARIAELKEMPINMRPYIRGNFEYTNTGKVYFEQYDEGIWLVAVHPYFSVDSGIDTRNRFRRHDGSFYPPTNVEYCIGYDPVRYDRSDVQSSHFSRAAAIVHKKFDYYNSGIVDVKCALMLYRPDDAREADREVIKACKYYSALCMHERLIEGVKKEFEKANMMPFLMPSDPESKNIEYGIWTDSGGKIVKNGVDMLVTRYSAPKFPEEVDQIATYPFEDGLADLDGFDMANTTAFDVTMSEIMLEYGLKQINFTNRTDKTDTSRIKAIHEIFPTRN